MTTTISLNDTTIGNSQENFAETTGKGSFRKELKFLSKQAFSSFEYPTTTSKLLHKRGKVLSCISLFENEVDQLTPRDKLSLNSQDTPRTNRVKEKIIELEKHFMPHKHKINGSQIAPKKGVQPGDQEETQHKKEPLSTEESLEQLCSLLNERKELEGNPVLLRKQPGYGLCYNEEDGIFGWSEMESYGQAKIAHIYILGLISKGFLEGIDSFDQSIEIFFGEELETIKEKTPLSTLFDKLLDNPIFIEQLESDPLIKKQVLSLCIDLVLDQSIQKARDLDYLIKTTKNDLQIIQKALSFQQQKTIEKFHKESASFIKKTLHKRYLDENDIIEISTLKFLKKTGTDVQNEYLERIARRPRNIYVINPNETISLFKNIVKNAETVTERYISESNQLKRDPESYIKRHLKIPRKKNEGPLHYQVRLKKARRNANNLFSQYKFNEAILYAIQSQDKAMKSYSESFPSAARSLAHRSIDVLRSEKKLSVKKAQAYRTEIDLAFRSELNPEKFIELTRKLAQEMKKLDNRG